MKKIAILLSVFLFFFTACSFSNSTENNQEEENNSEFFSRPERDPDIRMGSIKSIIGNEVVILVRDLSVLEEMRNSQSGSENGGMQVGIGSNNAGRMGMVSRMSDEDREKMREMMEKIPTQEYKVIIPVGILMGKRIRDESGMIIEDASLSDLKIGSSLSIWLQADTGERKIAETVLISGGGI